MRRKPPWWLWLLLVLDIFMFLFLACVSAFSAMLAWYYFGRGPWMSGYWTLLGILSAAHAYKLLAHNSLQEWERNG